jgi:hypothetical protein
LHSILMPDVEFSWESGFYGLERGKGQISPKDEPIFLNAATAWSKSGVS